MQKLQNCWEVMKCGFGPKGSKTRTDGVCPAAKEKSLDGVHGGINGGRACWFVENAFDCGKGAQGDFSSKYPICRECKFYRQVKKEEGSLFELSLVLNTYMQNR